MRLIAFARFVLWVLGLGLAYTFTRLAWSYIAWRLTNRGENRRRHSLGQWLRFHRSVR